MWGLRRLAIGLLGLSSLDSEWTIDAATALRLIDALPETSTAVGTPPAWLLALAALAGIAGWEARRRTRDFTIGERAAGRFA